MRRRHDDHVRCRLPDRGLPRRIVLLQIPLEHHLLVMRMMLVMLMVLMVLNIRMIVLAAATAHPNRNATPAEVLHFKLVAVPTPIERSSALVMVVVMMVMFDLWRRRRYGGELLELLLLLGGGRRRLTWDSRRFVAERREAYTVEVGRLGHLVLEHGLEQGFPVMGGRKEK
uniref:(northern house mosquito) hypothetical protein n=1 Tax=Culex pipiens TaxID=7175 RepID=A0A8D8CGC5_CULPI